MGARMRGPSNHRWKGGKALDGHGYVTVRMPEHHRAGANGRVFEHILVAERALGRLIQHPAEVHHVNGIKGDNRNENLVICEDRGFHMLLHQRARAYTATGNPKALRCRICGQWGVDDIAVKKSGAPYHRACNATYERGRKERGGAL